MIQNDVIYLTEFSASIDLSYYINMIFMTNILLCLLVFLLSVTLLRELIIWLPMVLSILNDLIITFINGETITILFTFITLLSILSLYNQIILGPYLYRVYLFLYAYSRTALAFSNGFFFDKSSHLGSEEGVYLNAVRTGYGSIFLSIFVQMLSIAIIANLYLAQMLIYLSQSRKEGEVRRKV